MKTLQFTVKISASANKVYRTMLGLDEKRTYEYWTAAFNPTSSFEGSWEQGSKIYFVGTNENGKKGGMVSKIEENRPSDFVSIRHYGFLDGDNEVTSGEMVEKWSGGIESYTFEENEGITKVTVNCDTVEEYIDYFNKSYPVALEKLKEISEG
ncbi:MAG: SRPBCC domain-containing protein [Flavobacterium sp.]|nr:SRPBCC domain-containing protein [Flavobacterium sp.]